MKRTSMRTVIIVLIFLSTICFYLTPVIEQLHLSEYIFYRLASYFESENNVPYIDKQIMKAIGAALTELNEPYELKFSGIGFSAEHETGKNLIRNVNVFLNSHRLTKKNDARKILVEYAELFIANVNQIEGAKDYLNSFPYKIQDVDVVIFLGKYQNPLSPNIKSIELRNGIVTYETVEPGEEHQSTYEHETIEEALRIVHEDLTKPME